MTGLHVVRVDVHVQGVSFEKENKALQSGAESAALEAGEAEPEKLTEPVAEEFKPDTPENAPEEEKKPAKAHQRNSKGRKQQEPENPEEEKPAEET